MGPDSWLHVFRTGSVLHFATLGWCAGAVAAFALWGRSLGQTDRERTLRRAWVLGMASLSLVVLSIVLLPANFDARYSLPLHLCDLAILVAGIALWTRSRWSRALTYFWTIGLSTQAFLTPIVVRGPAHAEYWFFWILHVQVVGAAVYDLVVYRFRPTARDFLVGCGATLLYGALILPLDIAFDWNYGFLGKDDRMGAGTLLEYLPPWPQRLPVMLGLAVGGMALLWLFWPALERLRRRSPRPDAGDNRSA